MSTFFSISLHVAKANMLQNPSFISPAPVFAAVMAAHALDMRLGTQSGGGLGIKGVGIIHHDCRPWVENLTTNENNISPVLVQRRGAYLIDGIDEPQSTPLQPMALTDLHWTLILHCEHDGETIHLEKALRSMRLAGGQITRFSVQQHKSLDEAIRHIRTGFWIEDASSLLSLSSIEQPIKVRPSQDAQKSDSVAPTTRAIELSPNPAERILQLTTIHPFTLPVNLGYSLLEDPMERRGARDFKGVQCAHAYAEHLIGLVRLISLRQALESNAISTTKLWRHGWVGNEFIVTADPNQILSQSASPGSHQEAIQEAA